MNNFIFENSTKVYFGKGCVKEYLACLAKKQKGNIMLCYGEGSIKKNGIYEEVTGILASTGKEVFEFSDIMPNPTYKKVLEGAGFAREHQIGLILGVGGGSVMDCCKAISLAARYDGDVWGDFWERPGMIDFEPLPLGVIVTAAGTGSECNGGAVITNEEQRIKTGRDYPPCNPKFARWIRLILTAFRNFRWCPVALIPYPISWKSISVDRMRIMFRMIWQRL